MKRRRLWILLGIIIALASAGSGAWFLWLPHYRPALEPGERFGIDVSHHQGSIDWRRVAGDDVGFAYIKATQRDDFVDPRFVENWRGAGEAGLERGAYHFFSLCASGLAQADHFLSVLPDEPGMLDPAVDLELLGTCDRRPDAAGVARELEAFLRRVEGETGRNVVLYVGDDFEALYPVRDVTDRQLWVLRYLRRPDGAWKIWQVGGYAHIDGIEGSVDLDVIGAP